MQLSVTGKHVEVGQSLTDHATAAIAALVDRYFGAAIEGRVTLERGRHGFRAEIHVHVGRGIDARSRGEGPDAYGAFDHAAQRLESQLRRHKGRIVDRHHAAAEPAPLNAAHFVLSGEAAVATDGGAPAIVAEGTTELARLDLGAAVARLDLEDLSFLVFVHRSHGRLNVVYRRADGSVGWIDPTLPAGGVQG